MEKRKKGTKLFYCALGALMPVYWFHHRREKKNQRNNNQIIDDVEILRNLKMKNPFCHIPLIILTVYDGYIYENKILRKIYYRFRESPAKKVSVPSSSLLHNSHHGGNTTKTEGTHGPNYHFIMYTEKNIFNKMYFYEIILDKSVRYAVISPHLSFYILRQLSQHVVNLNTRLYNEKDFTMHREKRRGTHTHSHSDGHWVANWVMRLTCGAVWPDELRNSHHSDNDTGSDNDIGGDNDGEDDHGGDDHHGGDREAGKETPPQRKKNLRERARGNLYEKYGIHKYEETFSQGEGCDGTSRPPQHDQVSINLLYLLNKAYDSVSRICIDTETNLLVNLYMVNILKFICYKNYRNVLMNISLFEELDRENRKGRNLVDYFCALFTGGNMAEEGYFARDDADRHLFFRKEERGGEEDHSMLVHPAAKQSVRRLVIQTASPTGRSACTLSDIPPSKGIQKRNDKKDAVEKNTDDNRNHHIVNQEKVYHIEETDTSQTVSISYNHDGIPPQEEERKKMNPHNYEPYDCGLNGKMKIINDLYLVLYLRLVLECCSKIVSIKKNLLMLEEKVKFEKGNRVFYLNTSDAMENLKVHYLKRFRRGEEKRGFHVFFRPYGNTRGNGQPGMWKNIQPTTPLKKKLPRWHSTEVQPNNEEQSNIGAWKRKLRRHSKRVKSYMNKKIFKFKKMINYYVINLDEAIKNKYYKRIHEKNVKRINEYLKENTQKEMNMGRFHDMYSNIIANLNGILSFAYAVDTKNQAHRILALYNTCVFYQYNYLNEHDNLFFKNGVSRYLRRLGEWSSSEERREDDSGKEPSPSFYYKNDIHLLLLLYTQRIRNCLNIFTYIYNKNYFSKYCSLCCVFHKLNFIICSKRSSSHWVMNLAYLAYHNWFPFFSFLYFFCVYSYVAFFLMYQSNTFSSVRYFGIFSDPGLSLYFVKLYTNARSLSGGEIKRSTKNTRSTFSVTLWTCRYLF